MKKTLMFAVIIIPSLFATAILGLHKSSVQAAGSVTLDNTSLSVAETYYSSVGTSVKFGSPLDISNYSYDIAFTAANGCKVSLDNNASYVTSGVALSATQGAGSYLGSKYLYFKGIDDSQVGEGDESCTVTFTMNTGDPSKSGDSAVLTLVVKDDDAVPAFSLTRVSGPAKLTEDNAGAESNRVKYQLKTSDPPASTVKVIATATNDCLIGLEGGGKGGGGFTTGASKELAGIPWGLSFYVLAIDDTEVEGTHTCKINFSVSTSDPEYAGLSIGAVSESITDNDTSSKPTTPSTSTTKPEEAIAPDQTAPLSIALPEGMTDVLFNGETKENFSNKEIARGEVLVIKGKTLPNALVKLYIFSTPREAQAQANASGDWSYEILDLEEGNHHIEAEVIDASGNALGRSVIAQFSVVAAGNLSVATDLRLDDQASNGLSRTAFVGATVSLVLIASGLLAWYRIKNRHWPHIPVWLKKS